MTRRARIFGLLLVLTTAAAACQQPSESVGPGDGGASPVAPAVEPGQPTPEQPIDLPASSPVAPAVQPEPTGPESPIPFEPG